MLYELVYILYQFVYMNSYYMNSLMCIGINCYTNWYMFYTNSYKRTGIIPIRLYELVYLRFVDKNKKNC